MASPGNTKGMARAAAKRASDKSGFDTYDTQDKYSPSPIDEVTVVRKNSDLGKAALKGFKQVKDNLYSDSDKGKPGSLKDIATKKVANLYAGSSGVAPATTKTRGPQPKDYKFFKHTQKDNK